MYTYDQPSVYTDSVPASVERDGPAGHGHSLPNACKAMHHAPPMRVAPRRHGLALVIAPEWIMAAHGLFFAYQCPIATEGDAAAVWRALCAIPADRLAYLCAYYYRAEDDSAGQEWALEQIAEQIHGVSPYPYALAPAARPNT